MRLPDIDYTGSVQTTSQTADAPYEAAAGTAKAMQEGLAAYHEERVRSELTQAKTKVAKAAQDVDLELRGREYVTKKELRGIMGGQLPAHLEKAAPDDETAVPMWMASGAIVSHRLKQAVERAGSELTVGGGWRAAFNDQVLPYVREREHSAAAAALDAMHAYHVAQREQTYKDRLAVGGPGVHDELRRDLAEDRILSPQEQMKWVRAVEVDRELTPVRAALASRDPALIREQIKRLQAGIGVQRGAPIIENPDGTWSTERTITVESDGRHYVIPTIVDGKDVGAARATELFRQGANPAKGQAEGFASAEEANAYAEKRHKEQQAERAGDRAGPSVIPQGDRAQLIHQLQAQADAIETEEERRRKKALAENASRAYGRLSQLELLSTQAGVTPSVDQAFALVPPVGSVEGDTRKALVTYAKSIATGESKERKTNLALYHQLNQLMSTDPEAFSRDEITIRLPDDPRMRNPQPRFAKVSLLSLVNELSDADFKHFSALQAGLIRKGREDVDYKDFLGAEAYMKSKLSTDYGYDMADLDDDEKNDLARLKIIVNAELSAAARAKHDRLTTPERDQAIDNALRTHVKVKKGRLSDSRELTFEGVDPEIVVAMDVATRRRMTQEELQKAAADFEWYRDGITKAWSEQTDKPLSIEDAIAVYGVLGSKWGEIDQELQGKPLPGGGTLTLEPGKKSAKVNATLNGFRTAVAVRMYLAGPAGQGRRP